MICDTCVDFYLFFAVYTFYYVLDTGFIFFRLILTRLEKLIGVAAIELILKVVLEALVVDTRPLNFF